MMKKLLLPILLILILSACSANATPTAASAPADSQIEITDPTKPIETAAGSEFTITVNSNPSSGYHWEVAQELDTKVVDYVWKDYVPNDPGNPIGSGRDIWRFKAVAPGKTTIALGYFLGETENASQTPVYTVVVK